MTDAPRRPLTVIELAQGVAGPSCGRLFAALGHRVVKVEPPRGDRLRGRGDDFGFAHLNAGKDSVVAELESEPGIAVVRVLVEAADVLITDLPGDSLRRIGVIDRDGRPVAPRLVVVSVTGFGLDDVRSRHHADSLLAEAYGGLAMMIGEPDREPLSLGGEQMAYAAGFVGFFGAMLGVAGVRRGGPGDLVEVALADVAAYIDWKSDIGVHFEGASPRRTGTQHGRWRVVRSADGWAGIIYQPEQWPLLVELIGDERLADPALRDEGERDRRAAQWWAIVADWAAARTSGEIYAQAQAAGLAFGMDVDIAQLSSSAQLRARGFIRDEPDGGGYVGPVLRSAELGWQAPPPPPLGGLNADSPSWPVRRERDSAGAPLSPDGEHAPLAGMVVLDLGMITAGAAVGRLLADYGATVVKVESPNRPDPFRQWIGHSADGTDDAPVFDSNNAGKYGLALDLKSEDGLGDFLSLVKDVDVVIENFRVGVPERLGIGAATLRAVNPRLVYLSLSSQGQFGPECTRRSYGSTLDMLSGLASVTGYPGGPPMWSSAEVNYPDQLVSLLGAAMVVHCWNFGVGTHLDVSQREVVAWTLGEQISRYRATGEVPHATGNRRDAAVPHGVFRCAGDDSWIALACQSDAQREALAGLVGGGMRTAADDEGWEAAVSAWTAMRRREECLAVLEASGVPAAAVLSAEERAADPHFADRRVFLSTPIRRKGYPLLMHSFQPPAPRPAPRLGEHTEWVLEHVGGVDSSTKASTS